DGEKMGSYHQSELKAAASSDEGEEEAELVGYTAARELWDQIGSSWDAGSEIIDKLIDDNDPDDDEEIEEAQLETIRTYAMSMYGALNSIMTLCLGLLSDDDEPIRPRYMAGKRNSAADQKIIQGMHDHAVALGADCDP